ncbi:hypothetical protein Tco_0775246 [Tanacetum coccineum]
MDSLIPLGQKNTLVEYMILSGAENHSPMLDKDLYDSWKSIMELYMQNREEGRMILESVENGPLIWPTIEENGVTRTKKYAELSATEKIQSFTMASWERVQSTKWHRQCPKPKRKRDATWFRDKVLLVKAQGKGKVMNEDELGTFLQEPILFVDDKSLHAIADSSYGQNLVVTGSDVLAEGERLITVFNQMEAAVQQYHVEKQCFEIQKKQFLIENDRLLDQIISQDIVNIVVNSSLDKNTCVNVNSFVVINDFVNYAEMCNKCLELEDEPIKQHNMNTTSVNQTEPLFDQLFELNNLKAELQAKDTTIKKLKAHIKRVSETSTSESVKKDFDEIETINIELEHKVTRLITENEHLKHTYKQIYNSIKPSRVRAKEQNEYLVNQVNQIISQDIVNIVVNSSLDKNTCVNMNSFVVINDFVNYVEMCNKCLELEDEPIKQHNMVEKDEYNRLSKRFSKLEQHCISLEIAMQLNKEFFKKNTTSVNQTEPLFDQLFELNNLKAELQAKDTTIKKLKAHIKRVNETSTSESVKKDFDEIETINIELEHKVTRLITENEHLKHTYKQLYDSIKPSRVRAKEQNEYLVNQVNQKSVEISDLNAQLQEKVFVITSLRNDLRKLKGKDIVDNAAQMSNAATIAPEMYKLDLIILTPKVKNNREAHEYYLKHTMEQAAILREVVEQAKSQNPLDSASYSACMYVKLIQELLGVKPSTSASGSKPSGNTKNDRISRTPSSNEKNKVEIQSRKVKSKLNKQNSDSKNIYNEHVKHPIKGAQALCSVCNECLFDDNHAMCLIDHVNSMNVRAKSAYKKHKKRKEWKPTGKVCNSVGYKWKPTRRTFILVGNACPLTRLTATSKVPLRVPIPLEVVAPNQIVTRVYTRRPKVPKSVPNSKPKVAKSMTANRMKPGTGCPILQLLYLLLLLSNAGCPNCSVVYGLRLL